VLLIISSLLTPIMTMMPSFIMSCSCFITFLYNYRECFRKIISSTRRICAHVLNILSYGTMCTWSSSKFVKNAQRYYYILREIISKKEVVFTSLSNHTSVISCTPRAIRLSFFTFLLLFLC